VRSISVDKFCAQTVSWRRSGHTFNSVNSPHRIFDIAYQRIRSVGFHDNVAAIGISKLSIRTGYKTL